MKQKIVIVGTGETADIAFEYFSYDDIYEIAGFAVNKEYLTVDSYKNKPIVAIENMQNTFPPGQFKVFVAISSGKLNQNRENLYLTMKAMGYSCVSYISPKAFVWRTAEIGENCFIFENNVIQHGVKIGNNVTLWSGNHIGHQTRIRDHVFVSSHCVISGYCDIGENSFLGVNCTIADHIKVGRDCFIGMGALVGRSLENNILIKPAKSVVSDFSAKKLCGVE